MNREADDIRKVEKLQQDDLDIEKRDLLKGITELKQQINDKMMLSKRQDKNQSFYSNESSRDLFDEEREQCIRDRLPRIQGYTKVCRKGKDKCNCKTRLKK